MWALERNRELQQRHKETPNPERRGRADPLQQLPWTMWAERDPSSLPGTHLAYLPLGLLQPRPEFPLLPFKGSTAALQLLPLLQQLGKVILQLALLLLQLEHLQLQQLLGPLDTLRGLLCLGCTVLTFSGPAPLPCPECLGKDGRLKTVRSPQVMSSSISCLGGFLPGLNPVNYDDHKSRHLYGIS